MDRRKLLLFFIDVFTMVLTFCIILLLFVFSSSFLMNGELNTSFIRFVLMLVCIIASRCIFKVYNHIWRYAGVITYLRIVAADFTAGMVILFIQRINNILNLGFALTLGFVSMNCLATLCGRFLYQAWYSRRDTIKLFRGEHNNKIKVAIIGAGNIGAALAEELLRNPQSHYTPVCFVDIDKFKVEHKLNGLPVYPEDDKIIDRIKSMDVQEIVIALSDTDSEKSKKLYDLYRQTGCKINLYDYPLDSKRGGGKKSIREMHIEDLLFRNPVKFDSSVAKEYYKDKVVLVTGGGGSIGSELCRQIAKCSPKKLVIFDIYENNAYSIQQELLRIYGNKLDLDVLIGSVRDVQRLEQVFSHVRPQIVFHAAAHKHVPLMERSAAEAIKNNVFGTYNTANAAEKYGAEKFVLISTDKAVNPTNVMGASKRLCEMIVQCRRDSNTCFVAVRFGNVLGSNGSVVKLFQKQIENGGPVTITDKRIIRYFMTIPEASQLVLQTGAMANKGELYVLDMGKPVQIYELAKNMICLAGYVPDQDIKIKEVGLRPGEKLYEELLIKDEEMGRTENELIFIERDKPFTRDQIDEKLKILLDAEKLDDPNAVKAAFRQVVPTYNDPDEVNSMAVSSYEMNLSKESEDSLYDDIDQPPEETEHVDNI